MGSEQNRSRDLHKVLQPFKLTKALLLIDVWQKPQYEEMFECHQLCVGFADQARLFEKINDAIIRQHIPQIACEHFDTRLVWNLKLIEFPPQYKNGYQM